MDIKSLRNHHAFVTDLIATNWSISKNTVLKASLAKIEEDIARMEGRSREYFFAQKVKQRISDLETEKAKAQWDKAKCKDIAVYRNLVSTIESADRNIEAAKEMLKGLI